MSLPFKIETRGDTSVLCWPDGSCRPASTAEQQLWDELKRLEGLILAADQESDMPSTVLMAEAKRIRGEKP